MDSLRLTRGEVLVKGVLAAAAAYGLTAVEPYVQKALAASGEDAEINALNLALSFELLEARFYEDAKTRLKPTGSLKQLIDSLAEDERRHIDALTAKVKELGGTPEPEGDYAFAYRDAYEALRLIRDIETAGIGAYNGAIPYVKSESAFQLMASIAQIEGRHAAAVRMERGGSPAPRAFDPGVTEFQSRAAVEIFTGVFSGAASS